MGVFWGWFGGERGHQHCMGAELSKNKFKEKLGYKPTEKSNSTHRS